MTIQEIKDTLGAKVIYGEEYLLKEVHNACGSDMMSDVLAFVKDQSVLLTGLCNPHVLRTAEMNVRPDVVRKVAISLYEGEINMVIHSYGGTINVYIMSDKILMELEDLGPGIEDIDKAMQEGYSTAPESVRSLGFGAGMGLPNMKKYVDKLDIESELDSGTLVKMMVSL